MLRLEFDIPDYLAGAAWPGLEAQRRRVALSLAESHAKAVEGSARANAPVRSGRLRDSIRAYPIDERRGALEASAPHAKFVHEGTGVHGPGKKPYAIKPKTKLALYWPGAGHPAKAVVHEGLKPSGFLRASIEQSRVDAQMRMEAEAARKQLDAELAVSRNMPSSNCVYGCHPPGPPPMWDTPRTDAYADNVGNSPVNCIDPLGLTSAPGFWESLIPVWGSGKQAVHEFECGRWVQGTFYTAMAISDVFLVKTAYSALAKGTFKIAGSHTWSATSKWLTKQGWREFKGQQMHHWLIPQSGWGTYVPNAIKNQPWNLMRMRSRAYHDALHGTGRLAMNHIERVLRGNPTWFKLLIFSGSGRVIQNWQKITP